MIIFRYKEREREKKSEYACMYVCTTYYYCYLQVSFQLAQKTANYLLLI